MKAVNHILPWTKTSERCLELEKPDEMDELDALQRAFELLKRKATYFQDATSKLKAVFGGLRDFRNSVEHIGSRNGRNRRYLDRENSQLHQNPITAKGDQRQKSPAS